MSKQPQLNIDKIKSTLLSQQKKVEQEIKAIDEDDPVTTRGGLAESSEPGTDSWMADVHGRAVAVKHSLSTLLARTKQALNSIKSGKYGKCERCGKPIEADRLEAMPTATLCIACSGKPKVRDYGKSSSRR